MPPLCSCFVFPIQVIELLKCIALVGKVTVVLVIHQPRYDIFEKFDDLILLERGGRIAFQGSPDSAQVSGNDQCGCSNLSPSGFTYSAPYLAAYSCGAPSACRSVIVAGQLNSS